MTIGEALRLGSLTMKPFPGHFYHDGNDSGCALGMINNAVGGSRAKCHYQYREAFPEIHNTLVPYPCDCVGSMVVGGGCAWVPRTSVNNIEGMVCHLFNYHVCQTKDWTIDRLAEWLDQVYPHPVPAEALAEMEKAECVPVKR